MKTYRVLCFGIPQTFFADDSQAAEAGEMLSGWINEVSAGGWELYQTTSTAANNFIVYTVIFSKSDK